MGGRERQKTPGSEEGCESEGGGGKQDWRPAEKNCRGIRKGIYSESHIHYLECVRNTRKANTLIVFTRAVIAKESESTRMERRRMFAHSHILHYITR